MPRLRLASVALVAVTFAPPMIVVASAQDAAPATKNEAISPAPDPIDKGVPPAKRTGDEGGKPSSATSGQAPAADGSAPSSSQ